MISSGDNAVCVLCCNKVVCRTSSGKRHFETNHKDLYLKTKEKQREIISKACKEKKMQSSNLMKFIGGSSNVTAASYIVSKKLPNTSNHSVKDNLSNKHGLNVHRFYSKILKKKKKLFRE